MAVSAFGDYVSTGNGAVYLFSVDPLNPAGTVNFSKKLSAATTGLTSVGPNEAFGSSVALNNSGSALAIGAIGAGAPFRGAVYLMNLNPADLTLDPTVRGRLDDSLAGLTLTAHDSFGYSVALNGPADLLIVGDPFSASGGSVHTFSLDGTLGATYRATTNIGNGFGNSVALNSAGNIAAIGAPFDDTGNTDAGRVYIYSAVPATGVLTQQSVIDDSYSSLTLAASKYFGTSLALNDAGNLLAIGSSTTSSGHSSGVSVDIMSLNTSDLTNSAMHVINISDAHASLTLANSESFARSLAFNDLGNVLLIGAPLDDDFYTDSGAIYYMTLDRFLDPRNTYGSGTFYAITSDIESLINAGTNVTLEATNNITTTGNLDLNGLGNLTLEAGNNITLTNHIINASTGDITIEADNHATISINISTLGDLIITADKDNSNAGNISLSDNLTAATTVLTGENITQTAGTITSPTLTSTSRVNSSFATGFTAATSADITATTGSVEITGGTIDTPDLAIVSGTSTTLSGATYNNLADLIITSGTSTSISNAISSTNTIDVNANTDAIISGALSTDILTLTADQDANNSGDLSISDSLTGTTSAVLTGENITQTAGTITSPTLTSTSRVNSSFASGFTSSTSADITATTGSVAITGGTIDTPALTLTAGGDITSSGATYSNLSAITITATGDLDLQDAITASTNIDATADNINIASDLFSTAISLNAATNLVMSGNFTSTANSIFSSGGDTTHSFGLITADIADFTAGNSIISANLDIDEIIFNAHFAAFTSTITDQTDPRLSTFTNNAPLSALDENLTLNGIPFPRAMSTSTSSSNYDEYIRYIIRIRNMIKHTNPIPLLPTIVLPEPTNSSQNSTLEIENIIAKPQPIFTPIEIYIPFQPKTEPKQYRPLSDKSPVLRYELSGENEWKIIYKVYLEEMRKRRKLLN